MELWALILQQGNLDALVAQCISKACKVLVYLGAVMNFWFTQNRMLQLIEQEHNAILGQVKSNK